MKATQGPDFSNCGNPVIWGDRQPIDERFLPAITNALASPCIDVELAKWDSDDSLTGEYEKWWTAQLGAVRRELATISHQGYKPVVARRVDKSDGFTKCYIRFNRQRPQVLKVAV